MKSIKYYLIALLLILTGCANQKKEISFDPVTQNKFLLGTVVTITLYDNPEEEIFDEIFNELEKIEKEMTINNAITSEVIEINNHAGIEGVKVSKNTFDVINTGLNYSKLANGAFDITVGPLVKLWEIGFTDARVPSHEEISKALELINYEDVELNEEQLTVKLTKPGMMIDLGGIAKGYAADTAIKILKEHGNQHAIINLGGNVYAYGDKPQDQPWKIGIQNPFLPRGEYLGIASVKNKAIVTSGTYERFFEQDGVTYHHILDPKTGYPVSNNIVSVTIIADNSMVADALSTAAFALGIESGLALIESLDQVEALYITNDNQIYPSSGFMQSFELTDDTFTIIDSH